MRKTLLPLIIVEFFVSFVQAGTISGTVTTNSDGTPIANAYIYIYDYDSGTYWDYAYTDAAGQYTTTNLPAGQYRIICYASGYPSQYYNGQFFWYQADPVTVLPSQDTTGIDFIMTEACSISGTIVDTYDLPIEGIGVWLCDYFTQNCGQYATTNSNGEYSFTNIAPGTYSLRTDTSGTDYINEYYDNAYDSNMRTPVFVDEGQDITGIDFELLQGISISGTITDSNGLPVENAEVSCYSWYDHQGYDWTDANGDYMITALLPNKYYRLGAYPPEGSKDAITPLDVTVTDVPIVGADIQLDPNGVTVSGIVTVESTGQPYPNTYVGIHIDQADYKFYGGHDYTETNGFYMISNLPQVCNVEIHVEPEDYARMSQGLCLSQDITDLNFELTEGSSISGIVIDADTGQPMPGIDIEFWNEEYSTGDWQTTDSAGHFTLSGLYPGVGEMNARPTFSSGYLWSIPWPQNHINLPASADIKGRFVTIQKGTVGTGRLLDGSGIPLVNTRFNYATPQCDNWENYTDSNGQFEIRLPLGTYQIVFELEEDDSHSVYSQQIVVPDLATSVSLGDIYFYSETDGQTISGTFSNPTDASCEGMFLIIAFPANYQITPENIQMIRPIAEVDMSEPGSYQLGSLPPNNVDVYMICSDFGQLSPESVSVRSAQINVSPGSTNIDLVYPSEGGTVTGRVINHFNEGVIGASVMLTDSTTGEFAGFATTQADGLFGLYNLQAGTYDCTAVHLMYVDTVVPSVTITEGGTTNVPDITIDFAGIKQGPDLNGDGVLNIMDIGIYVDQWLDAGSADLNASGTVDLADFAPFSNLWMSKAIWRQ